MKQEIWKTAQFIFTDGHIEIYENYEVSNRGNVRSVNYKNTKKAKVLKPSLHGNYYQVSINQKWRSIHRLVASTFIKCPCCKLTVNHIDENKLNNTASNLEWLTYKDNSNYGTRNARHSEKLMNRPDQSRHVRVTFSDKTQKVFPSAREAGRNIGIRPDVVSVTINQRRGYYKRLGLYFEYV